MGLAYLELSNPFLPLCNLFVIRLGVTENILHISGTDIMSFFLFIIYFFIFCVSYWGQTPRIAMLSMFRQSSNWLLQVTLSRLLADNISSSIYIYCVCVCVHFTESQTGLYTLIRTSLSLFFTRLNRPSFLGLSS